MMSSEVTAIAENWKLSGMKLPTQNTIVVKKESEFSKWLAKENWGKYRQYHDAV